MGRTLWAAKDFVRADAPPDHMGFAGPELLAVLPGCPPVFRPRHLPDAARPTHELYPQACPKSATPLQIIYELRHRPLEIVLLLLGQLVPIRVESTLDTTLPVGSRVSRGLRAPLE